MKAANGAWLKRLIARLRLYWLAAAGAAPHPRCLGGLNTVTIFTLPVQTRPELVIDGLEIVAVHWLSREQALARELPGHVRCYLNQQ